MTASPVATSTATVRPGAAVVTGRRAKANTPAQAASKPAIAAAARRGAEPNHSAGR